MAMLSLLLCLVEQNKLLYDTYELYNDIKMSSHMPDCL